MPTSTKVKNLNINELTEAQYDAAVQGGVIGANELSVLTDVDYVEPSDLATVATSGSYNDLTNKPTIPAAQVNSDWDAVSGVAQILNKPTIPTVGDGTITITQGGVTKGTFTTNQSGNTTIEVDAGGSALPSQTGNAGKFLTTDGTDASWSDKVVVDTNLVKISTDKPSSYAVIKIGAIGNGNVGVGSINIGTDALAPGFLACAIGNQSRASGQVAMALGGGAVASANYAYQFGKGTNSEANTFKVGFGNNYNYTIIGIDGTIPTARLTKVNTAITLAAAGWSSNTQTVSVTGMTATGVVLVSPDPTDQSAYTSAGIICSAQAAGSLTFTCDTVPSGDLSVNVVML